MAISDATIAFLEEQLSGLGAIKIRRMFGGGGVYADGVMFGLVADDVLYFKADEKSCQPYRDEGMGPFVYDGNGKPITMSYWRVPERLFDEPDEMLEWARLALEVARRGAVRKPKKPKTT